MTNDLGSHLYNSRLEMIMRFEVDPTLVADAIREGRKLIIEIDPRIGRRMATLGRPSPHFRHVNQQRKSA